MKCVACGSTSMVEGTLIDSSGSRTSIFKPDDVSTWKSMFGVGTCGVRAYGCVHCHHLQLSVDFDEDDNRRYQRFEGEQPSILERLNSESDEIER